MGGRGIFFSVKSLVPLSHILPRCILIDSICRHLGPAIGSGKRGVNGEDSLTEEYEHEDEDDGHLLLIL